MYMLGVFLRSSTQQFYRAYGLFSVLFRGQPGPLVDVVVIERLVDVVCFCDVVQGVELDGVARESVEGGRVVAVGGFG